MFDQISTLIVLTLTPFFELRASIPYGVFATDLPLSLIFLLAVAFNILLAPLLYLFLNKVVHLFLEFKFIKKIYQKLITRTQKRVEGKVHKYGVLGLALFIAVPLPGSGVYSGALVAYVLGFNFRDFMKASIIGVLIAGIMVTLISVSGFEAWGFLLKK
jgi:uncharacterized membrane protein